MKLYLCGVALLATACGGSTAVAPTPDPVCLTQMTGQVRFQNTDTAHAIDIYVDHQSTATAFLFLNAGELSAPVTMSVGGHFAEYGIVGDRGQTPCQIKTGIFVVALCAGSVDRPLTGSVTCP